MSRISYSKPITLLDGVSATGASDGINVKDYRHVVLAIGTGGSANLTLQVKGSIEDTADSDEPSWGTSASESNLWSYIAVKDLEDQSTKDGDDGLVFTGTDDVYLVEVNTNGLNWLAVDVTAHSAGTITVKAQAYGN